MSGVPCSVLAAQAQEQYGGTAPHALTWVILEHPGPWGRNAVTDSNLPVPVRDALLAMKAQGVGVLLARSRSHASEHPGHRIFVARTAPGGMLLREGTADTLDEILKWDPEALAGGSLPAFGRSTQEPLLLVCTHSKRDTCCATEGRSLITALHSHRPELSERVWECSHIGGHRFAPVTLALPCGAVHGGTTGDEADLLLDRVMAGQVIPDRMRGRSYFPAPLQAAGVAVRKVIDETAIDAIDVLVVSKDRAVPVDPGWAVPTVPIEVEIRHIDGRTWRATVSHVTDDNVRPESCGAEPTPIHRWDVRDIQPATPWC